MMAGLKTIQLNKAVLCHFTSDGIFCKRYAERIMSRANKPALSKGAKELGCKPVMKIPELRNKG